MHNVRPVKSPLAVLRSRDRKFHFLTVCTRTSQVTIQLSGARRTSVRSRFWGLEGTSVWSTGGKRSGVVLPGAREAFHRPLLVFLRGAVFAGEVHDDVVDDEAVVQGRGVVGRLLAG